LLAFMNHFPLFALVLRVKDPWRLPGSTSSLLMEQADDCWLTGGIYFLNSSTPFSTEPSLIAKVATWSCFCSLNTYIHFHRTTPYRSLSFSSSTVSDTCFTWLHIRAATIFSPLVVTAVVALPSDTASVLCLFRWLFRGNSPL
jgi:hypothetical protein